MATCFPFTYQCISLRRSLDAENFIRSHDCKGSQPRSPTRGLDLQVTELCIHQFTPALCMHAQSLQLCPTFCHPMEPTRLLCPWDSPGKNTGVGCHSLLQGNLGLQHCRWVLYHLSHQVGAQDLSEKERLHLLFSYGNRNSKYSEASCCRFLTLTFWVLKIKCNIS